MKAENQPKPKKREDLGAYGNKTSESRLFRGAQDLQFMIDLVLRVRPARRITDYPSPEDLREVLSLAEVRRYTRLWFDAEEQPTGFAFVDQSNNLCFDFDRQRAGPGIEGEMVTWGEQCLRDRMAEGGNRITLDASCREDDREKVAFLEDCGFRRQNLRTLHLLRSLDQPIPEPRLPEGFSVRVVEGEHEAAALVELHRAAFGTEEMTVEERLAMMRVPGYNREMDLLVVAPDGRLAAYCLCSISEEENERTGRKAGYTDPVATRPEYRRLGLAKALLLTGLRALKARGMDTAALGTSSENESMLKAAESVGFRIESSWLWYAKVVE
ncbi:MAG: GNAT family N-acetyltransferase [Spirochaetales bacterium]|nr:GNAT family N-acetyltransferase [Spirochaetales bacterium]